MVLLAAAVCNRTGKALVSRQFVEMTRSRIEGLLAAFPKLMGSGKQHTFVETESVRYVYQPLEKLYVLLITTKASNILEDLETLRLFAKVIPEYCRSFEESEIADQAFSLIFAFDEIVALGYRENVNLAQIRTFTEMDSHEEKVFQAVRQTQEKEALDHMRRKAKEINQRNREMAKGGRMTGIGGGGGFGSSSYRNESPIIDASSMEPTKPSYSKASAKPSGPSKALKLGSKKKDVDTFVGQIQLEGEKVADQHAGRSGSSAVSKSSTPAANQESIHLLTEERMVLSAGRDGGLQNMEVHGILKLRVTEDRVARIKVMTINNDNKGIQIQTHPNIDKKLFLATSQVSLKNPDKPFPLNQEVGVLKWRLQTQDEALIPLSINCWPSESSSGCDVNIEYELEQADMQLEDVVISIPCPSGAGSPTVGDCDGDNHYDGHKRVLQWSLPFIDATNKSGSMEFSLNGGHPDDFFPVSVSFTSRKPYCDIQVTEVKQIDDDQPEKFSTEVAFYVEKYEIV
ncbi:coatomer subunit delta-like [Littorina saxatilis]|uniref:Coatomer subunit delta n=1 Tax=Littorina saxatilis TaxID=31220 RepID=A0AAN9BJA2_9CAEN